VSRAARLRRLAALEVETLDSRIVARLQVELRDGAKPGTGLAWRVAVSIGAALVEIETAPGMLPAPVEFFDPKP